MAAVLLHLFGVPVHLGVAHVMAPETVGDHVQQRRSVAVAGPLDRFGRGGGHSGHVVAVHRRPLHAIGDSPHGQVVDRCGSAAGCELGVLVVLAHVHHTQLLHRREVERLMEGALVDPAVAEEAHRRLVGAAVAGRQRGPGRDPEPAADDAVGTEHAQREVGHMHRASPAPARAPVPPEQLGHQRGGRHALGQRVPVPPVGGGDVVVLSEVGAYSGRDRLLAQVGVDEPRQLARLEQLLDAALEHPDQHHGPVQGQGLGPLQGWRRHGHCAV